MEPLTIQKLHGMHELSAVAAAQSARSLDNQAGSTDEEGQSCEKTHRAAKTIVLALKFDANLFALLKSNNPCDNLLQRLAAFILILSFHNDFLDNHRILDRVILI